MPLDEDESTFTSLRLPKDWRHILDLESFLRLNLSETGETGDMAMDDLSQILIGGSYLIRYPRDGSMVFEGRNIEVQIRTHMGMSGDNDAFAAVDEVLNTLEGGYDVLCVKRHYRYAINAVGGQDQLVIARNVLSSLDTLTKSILSKLDEFGVAYVACKKRGSDVWSNVDTLNGLKVGIEGT
jgi:hypothetical protein